jgi:proline iminopeptidase
MGTSDGYITNRDGLRLYFRTAGSGSHHVLIPNGIYLFDDFQRFASGRTLVFYDLRNRGRSDAVDDPAMLEGGIRHDVDDLDDVRRYFGADRVDVLGHSYVGVTVVLYASMYKDHVRGVVQIGAPAPDPRKQYPPHLSNVDETLSRTLARLGELENERATLAPEQFCEKFWAVLRPIYVTDPANAHRITWSRCDLANERNFMPFWIRYVLPSLERLQPTPQDLAGITAPVLVIHGTKDRSGPYGGGVDWAASLPNARLLTVEGGCHCPWIEAPDLVFDAVETFLKGGWPEAAQTS